MTNKSVAIITEDIVSNIDLIEKIKNFIVDRNDFIIFTDNIIFTNNEHGILSTFYLISYDGLLVFLDINDFLKHKDNILAKPVLYLENYNNLIDKNILKGCSIITQSNNQLQWVNNYELPNTL